MASLLSPIYWLLLYGRVAAIPSPRRAPIPFPFRKTEDGRRKTEDGRRKTEDGRRKTEDGRRKTEDGNHRYPVANLQYHETTAVSTKKHLARNIFFGRFADTATAAPAWAHPHATCVTPDGPRVDHKSFCPARLPRPSRRTRGSHTGGQAASGTLRIPASVGTSGIQRRRVARRNRFACHSRQRCSTRRYQLFVVWARTAGRDAGRYVLVCHYSASSGAPNTGKPTSDATSGRPAPLSRRQRTRKPPLETAESAA